MNRVDVCFSSHPSYIHFVGFVFLCVLVIFAMPIVFASHTNACMVWQLSKEKIRSILFVVWNKTLCFAKSYGRFCVCVAWFSKKYNGGWCCVYVKCTKFNRIKDHFTICMLHSFDCTFSIRSIWLAKLCVAFIFMMTFCDCKPFFPFFSLSQVLTVLLFESSLFINSILSLYLHIARTYNTLQEFGVILKGKQTTWGKMKIQTGKKKFQRHANGKSPK